MKTVSNRAIWGLLISAAILTGGTAIASDQASPAAPEAASPLAQLVWHPDHLEIVPKLTESKVSFSFGVTNRSDSEAVIDRVEASCSCTVAKLPSQPWHLLPHTTGEVGVTVDLTGKFGEFSKKLTVYFADKTTPAKVLTVTVKMPDRKTMRENNMKLATADRQAVLKGECANCHAEAAQKHATGMVLFHEICGICHEARPRASMVSDLRMINTHPTDVAFWKTMIANGKPGTLMPAFAISQGGILTDEQIDSLAKAIDEAYPYARFSGQPPAPAPASPKN